MKQVLSIFLTVLLLASSSGIAYAQHFCGDHEMMAKVTLGEAHLSCGMDMPAPGCDDESEKEHDCCSNTYTKVDTDDNYSYADVQLDIDPDFLVAFVTTFILQPQEIPNPNDGFRDYHPPPLEKDVQVVYQVFLI